MASEKLSDWHRLSAYARIDFMLKKHSRLINSNHRSVLVSIRQYMKRNKFVTEKQYKYIGYIKSTVIDKQTQFSGLEAEYSDEAIRLRIKQIIAEEIKK